MNDEQISLDQEHHELNGKLQAQLEDALKERDTALVKLHMIRELIERMCA